MNSRLNNIFKIVVSLIMVIVFSSWIFSEGDNGYFVYLHGKKQYVLVEGTGEPTIVFLTGKGTGQNDFKKVYNKIKNTNRIFSYDRAGLGKSEAFRNDRTVDTMAYELHELLEKEKIKPPYILVGHALGGYIMRCFVSLYPTTVSGVVFVDPSHEFEFKHGLEIRPDSDQVVFRDEFKSYLRVEGRSKVHNAESKKCFDFDSAGFSTNQRIVKDIQIPTDIPMTILIARKVDVDNAFIDKEMEYRIQFFEKWKTMNVQTKVVTTFKSGHFIHRDHPQLVIDEINEIIGKVRK
ncbi:MAG: alpha/beta hydrolase [Burkholderiales bacterium]|nr:alpha/beta hydrolase [Bacteroidia bacterium]